jgi:alpha-beta hydrolase superfamily lysophospholipase
MAWLSRPAGRTGTTGVVLVPPLGYEYWTTHRTLRVLADRLADQGCTVLRYDLPGQGDSSGGPEDPDLVDAWRGSVSEAATFLRGIGSTSLVVAGVRFGATLALLEGVAAGADRVIAWAPVVQGRAYVRELQLLAETVPADAGIPGTAAGIAHAGSVVGPETLVGLRSLDLTHVEQRPAPRVLIVDRDDRPSSEVLLSRLATLGADTEQVVVPGSERALDRPAEYAEVADEVVQEICRWVGQSPAGGTPLPSCAAAATRWDADGMSEEVLSIGPNGLVGILTEPVGRRRATVVWLNSGSEPHIGPGRTWVEFARALVQDDVASLRVDFSGWGESPDHGHAPGRPYDAHCGDEVTEIIDDLRSRGHRQIVVSGLCAGAWIGLRAALAGGPDGVIAINPQLYWQPGDPVEASIATETRVRRRDEIRRIKAVRRTGLWWGLDAVGIRHPAATWLRGLERSGCPVLMVFAEGDDGLEFLEDRVGRTWSDVRASGRVVAQVVPDIDHPMHRAWHRRSVLDGIRQWLDALAEDPGPGQEPLR